MPVRLMKWRPRLGAVKETMFHLQGPVSQQLEAEGSGVVVGRVGDWVGRCAFSSLASQSNWVESDTAPSFMRAFRRARQWVNEAPATEVAASEASYFPDTPVEVLAETIGAYQALGCWSGQIEIIPEQIAVSVDVFSPGRCDYRGYRPGSRCCIPTWIDPVQVLDARDPFDLTQQD